MKTLKKYSHLLLASTLALASGSALADGTTVNYSPVAFDPTSGVSFSPLTLVTPFIGFVILFISAVAALLLIGKVWSMVSGWFKRGHKA